MAHRVFSLPFNELYPLYKAKVERKDADVADLDRVITWLTGYTPEALETLKTSATTLEEFLAQAPH